MELDIDRVLAFPLDCNLIMQKQSAIKRQLAAKSGLITKRIAILGGSTTAYIKSVLEIFLLHGGIRPEFYESEYNQYYADGAFYNQELELFKPNFIFIFTTMVNLMYMPSVLDDDTTVDNKIAAEFARYQKLWAYLEKTYGAIIIQNNIELPYSSGLGSLDSVFVQGQRNYIERLNVMFAQYARTHANFHIHDIHFLSAQVGLSRWHNRSQYYSYKFAVDYDVVPFVARSMAQIVKSVLGKNKKCLILDLDNTLWGGIIGDDDVNGIQVGHECPQAEAYTEFQQYVLHLKQRGIILAVCSKNDEIIAKSGFTHPDSVLTVEDFIAFKANWNPKHLNIKDIAAEINIGFDSLVFIDDNPFERQLVRENLPQVAVPEVDPNDVFSYIKAIEENGYFEPVAISQDDLKRNQTYIENRKRQEETLQFKTYDEFLLSLKMIAEIGVFKPIYFERITQLTNKSNQFNLTTRRYTQAEIASVAANEQYITLYGRLKDKFGDNGLVSVIIGKIKNQDLHIELWLMSCRVLKRNMEQAMLDQLVNEVKNRGIENIVGYYYQTKKNGMVAELYKSFGFTLAEQNNDDTVWKLNIENYQCQNQFILVN